MNSSNRKRRNSAYGYVSHSSSRSRRRRRRSNLPYFIGGALLIALLILIIVFIKKHSDASDQEETTVPIETVSNEIITMNAAIDLSDVLPDTDGLLYIKGMTPDEISRAITDMYDWSLRIVHEDANVGETVRQTVDINATTEAATMGDEDNPDGMNSVEKETESGEISVSDSIAVPDLVAAGIPGLVADIVSAEDAERAAAIDTTETEAETKKKGLFGRKKEEDTESSTEAETAPPTVFKFALDDYTAELDKIVEYADTMWYVEPHGGSIGSYDSSKDTFVMENSRQGFKVDRDALKEEIIDAIEGRDYVRTIDVPGNVTSAESNITVGDYRTIATYTTNTTANAVRNKNIRLACEALNGTIVRPGEEFSFNNTVGQRTEAKGYGAAAAYNNGEVVQEIGGGVCQVSTTLYNAVLKAGLKTTVRRSHTFKPTYVTPGQDATISWGGPDYKFANVPAIQDYSYKASYAIGIRASYANQKCTVSIYGRPVLKEGYEYSLSSTQIKELELVRELIEPGSDKVPTKGSTGSVWETRLIIKKDGETISDNVDHKAYYSGHKEYYLEESSSETDESASVSEVIVDEPLPPGGEPSPSENDTPIGPMGPDGTNSSSAETGAGGPYDDERESTASSPAGDLPSGSTGSSTGNGADSPGSPSGGPSAANSPSGNAGSSTDTPGAPSSGSPSSGSPSSVSPSGNSPSGNAPSGSSSASGFTSPGSSANGAPGGSSPGQGSTNNGGTSSSTNGQQGPGAGSSGLSNSGDNYISAYGPGSLPTNQ